MPMPLTASCEHIGKAVSLAALPWGPFCSCPSRPNECLGGQRRRKRFQSPAESVRATELGREVGRSKTEPKLISFRPTIGETCVPPRRHLPSIEIPARMRQIAEHRATRRRRRDEKPDQGLGFSAAEAWA